MRIAAIALAAIGLLAVSITTNAGVAPSHETSQLSQSGAKIAAPEKKENSEPPKQDEKAKEQDKDQKR